MTDQIKMAALLQGNGWHDLPFVPFRKGVDVYYIRRAAEGPVWALLRYEPKASVPRHRHDGLETIIVLEGSQSDEAGTYGTGTMVCNQPGSIHSVWSDEGCVVLIQWEKPVVILDKN